MNGKGSKSRPMDPKYCDKNKLKVNWEFAFPKIQNNSFYEKACKLFQDFKIKGSAEDFLISFETIKDCGTDNWEFFAGKFCKDNSCSYKLLTHLGIVAFY